MCNARLHQDFTGVKNEFDNIKIKTEIQDEIIPEEVFIDCTSYVSNDDKISILKTATKKEKQLDLDFMENQEIFDEITKVLKSTKSKM